MRGSAGWFIGRASRATPPRFTAVRHAVDDLDELRVIGGAAHAERARHVRRPHRDDVDALGGGDGVDLSTAGRSSIITASVISQLDCSMCSVSAILP